MSVSEQFDEKDSADVVETVFGSRNYFVLSKDDEFGF